MMGAASLVIGGHWREKTRKQLLLRTYQLMMMNDVALHRLSQLSFCRCYPIADKQAKEPQAPTIQQPSSFVFVLLDIFRLAA